VPEDHEEHGEPARAVDGRDSRLERGPAFAGRALPRRVIVQVSKNASYSVERHAAHGPDLG
jgi:hypothetical protein